MLCMCTSKLLNMISRLTYPKK